MRLISIIPYHFFLLCCFICADVEAGVADLMWPMTSPVVATAASQCCSLMAVALANNDVVIWNRDTGKYWRLFSSAQLKLWLIRLGDWVTDA